MRNTAVIMEDAMNCLIGKLGIVETEVFISNIIREPFDYTKWQHEKFDDVSLDDFCNQAVEYCKSNPVR
ncbi:MAG: hypothetical protein NC452_18240 [Eubacterium sp.]|nr:hypothetical protein [Eubacterium sp.]